MMKRNQKQAVVMTPLSIVVLLSLIVKSFFVNHAITDEVMAAGIGTEICFLALIVVSVSTLKTKHAGMILLTIDLIYSVFCLAALVYFHYYHAIFTYQSFSEINQAGEVSDGIFALLRPVYAWLFFDFLLFGVWVKLQRSFFDGRFYLSKRWTGYFFTLGMVFAGVSFVRSGAILNELGKYEQLGLIGYQFTEAAGDLHALFAEEKHINAATLAKNRLVKPEAKRRFQGIARNENVIIIQLEAVQNFLLNLKINGREVTPNLNKFAGSSYYFPHVYSQVGKGNTSDAEFITNTSLYPLGDVPMATASAGKAVPGLPRMLKQRGYQTATFHANSVSFWNRDQLYRSLGFDEYYDKKFFGSDDPISYGVSDEVMYKKTVTKLVDYQKQGKPFYAHIITLSSHFPYDLPESKRHFAIHLPPRFKDSLAGAYIEAVSYADYAFGQFVESLQKAGIYDRSLIVVYGDHQGLQIKTESDQELVNKLFAKPYDSVLDHLNVPLMIKVPSQKEGEMIETVGGQIDIYPTVANLLGIDLKHDIVFGTDLLNAANNVIGFRFYAPTGTYVNGNYRFLPGKNKGQGEIMDIQSRKQSQATKRALKEQDQLLTFMRLSDQYVESLPKVVE